MRMRSLTWLMVAGTCLSSVSCGGSGVRLTGTGATFPAPLYTEWFAAYYDLHPEVRIEYQATGSGSGVKAIQNQTADFGASDAAMSEEEMAKVERGVQLLPMTAGCIVLAYNLDEVPSLKLPRETYVGIFLGTVTRWNDPTIAKANPEVSLPDKPINVILRSDSSGTSYVFSKHLAAISPEAAKNPGISKTPNWPVKEKANAISASGNQGVTQLLKETDGAIGYIEFGYAERAGLAMAILENQRGNYVAASTESGQAALESVALPEDLVVWVSDPQAAEAYPVVTYTWMMCYKQYNEPKKAATLRSVLRYCLTKGQQVAPELGYLPLPQSVRDKVLEAVDNIQGPEASANE